MGLAAHRAAAGAAAAMGRGEGLVQVQVDAVEAHVAGPGHAHDGVQVGTVVIAQTAGLVDNTGDLQNVGIKNTHSVGVGQHQARGIGAHGGPEALQIHAALVIGRNVHHGEASHHGTGGVGAVGGVRDDDLGTGGIPPVEVVGPDQQQAGVLAMGAGGGLQGHGVHARDFLQQVGGLIHHFQAALDGFFGLQGVDTGEARQSRQFLMDAGVILHGAGAQGVEAVIDAVGLLGQFGVMALHVDFRQLGQLGRGTAQEFRRQGVLRGGAGGQQGTAAAGRASFKQQLHTVATSFKSSTRASIWPLLFISVTHHKMPPSTGRPPRMPFRANVFRTSSELGHSVTNSW